MDERISDRNFLTTSNLDIGVDKLYLMLNSKSLEPYKDILSAQIVPKYEYA